MFGTALPELDPGLRRDPDDLGRTGEEARSRASSSSTAWSTRLPAARRSRSYAVRAARSSRRPPRRSASWLATTLTGLRSANNRKYGWRSTAPEASAATSGRRTASSGNGWGAGPHRLGQRDRRGRPRLLQGIVLTEHVVTGRQAVHRRASGVGGLDPQPGAAELHHGAGLQRGRLTQPASSHPRPVQRAERR